MFLTGFFSESTVSLTFDFHIDGRRTLYAVIRPLVHRCRLRFLQLELHRREAEKTLPQCFCGNLSSAASDAVMVTTSFPVSGSGWGFRRGLARKSPVGAPLGLEHKTYRQIQHRNKTRAKVGRNLQPIFGTANTVSDVVMLAHKTTSARTEKIHGIPLRSTSAVGVSFEEQELGSRSSSSSSRPEKDGDIGDDRLDKGRALSVPRSARRSSRYWGSSGAGAAVLVWWLNGHSIVIREKRVRKNCRGSNH